MEVTHPFRQIQEFLNQLHSNLLRNNERDFWVEIVTVQPKCTYYFGPFETANEARTASLGYIEDLVGEGAQGIQTCVKYCRPTVLTILEE